MFKAGLGIIKSQIKSCNLKNMSFGFARKDGTIAYDSVKGAEEFAKNRVIQALKTPKPFERGIFLKGNRILGQVDGTESYVDFTDLAWKIRDTDITVVHGHPTNTPVSINDFLVMLTRKYKKMIAYNKKGEFSMLEEKSPSFLERILPEKLSKMLNNAKWLAQGRTVTRDYAVAWAKMFPNKYQKNIEADIHNMIGYPFAEANLVKKARAMRYSEKAYDEIESIENQVMKDGTVSNMVNEFWKNVTKKINYTYSTNFSKF